MTLLSHFDNVIWRPTYTHTFSKEKVNATIYLQVKCFEEWIQQHRFYLKKETIKSIFEIASAQRWAAESITFTEAKHLLELMLLIPLGN